MSTVDKLKNWFSQEVLEGQDVGLDDATHLLELGLIDSLTIVKLQQFIQAEFGVVLSHQHLTPQNLSTLKSIADVVAAQRAA